MPGALRISDFGIGMRMREADEAAVCSMQHAAAYSDTRTTHRNEEYSIAHCALHITQRAVCVFGMHVGVYVCICICIYYI
jgi:hypothetical protein